MRVLSARGVIRDMGCKPASSASRALTHSFALVGHYCSRLVSLAFVLDQLEQLAPLSPCAPHLFVQSRALEACPREHGTGKESTHAARHAVEGGWFTIFKCLLRWKQEDADMSTTVRAELEQIAVLAEYRTTGPGKGCKSERLTAAQATALRSAISQLAREALAKLPPQTSV
jgi:hypothetical protein